MLKNPGGSEPHLSLSVPWMPIFPQGETVSSKLGGSTRMCLAIPGKVSQIDVLDGVRSGRIEFGGITRQACLDFVPEANVGDYVMVHVGFAISVVDKDEAERTYAMLESMGVLAEELAPGGGNPKPS